MNKFAENYEKFNRRKLKDRSIDKYGNKSPNILLWNKWDTTHIRFVDTATPEEIMQEYELIKRKESDLSSKERGIIVNMVENEGIN